MRRYYTVVVVVVVIIIITFGMGGLLLAARILVNSWVWNTTYPLTCLQNCFGTRVCLIRFYHRYVCIFLLLVCRKSLNESVS